MDARVLNTAKRLPAERSWRRPREKYCSDFATDWSGPKGPGLSWGAKLLRRPWPGALLQGHCHCSSGCHWDWWPFRLRLRINNYRILVARFQLSSQFNQTVGQAGPRHSLLTAQARAARRAQARLPQPNWADHYSSLLKWNKAGKLRRGNGGNWTLAVQVKWLDTAFALPTKPRGQYHILLYPTSNLLMIYLSYL